jgi:hypothetical protein
MCQPKPGRDKNKKKTRKNKKESGKKPEKIPYKSEITGKNFKHYFKTHKAPKTASKATKNENKHK